MYELKKNGKVFTSKFVGTGPSSYGKRIYRAAVSQSLRNNDVEFHSKNKFEKLVHLVVFTISIYHDARSHERQNRYILHWMIYRPTCLC